MALGSFLRPALGTLLRARCPTERGRAPHYPCERRRPARTGHRLTL